MESRGIIINSKRTGGQWTATATLNGEFAGSCTAKSKAYAEKEAKKGAERFQNEQRRSLGKYYGPLQQLTETLKARAAAASSKMVAAMAVLILLGSCAQKATPTQKPHQDKVQAEPTTYLH